MKIFTRRWRDTLKPWQWLVLLWLGGVLAAYALSLAGRLFIFGLKQI